MNRQKMISDNEAKLSELHSMIGTKIGTPDHEAITKFVKENPALGSLEDAVSTLTTDINKDEPKLK